MTGEGPPGRYQWRPVHWREGMFLRPHHMQAADRHARDMLAASEDWYHPFAWGFRSLSIDRDALRAFTLKLLACDARFEDGTKLSVPSAGDPGPLKLEPSWFERSGAVEVRLAVPMPRHREGLPNVGEGARLDVLSRSVEDENTGDNPQTVEFQCLRCRLVAGPRFPEGSETLPVARVILADDGKPALDPTYVPPLLAVDGSTHLTKQIRAVHHAVSAKIDSLVVEISGSGRLFETQDPGAAERVLKLSTLNGAFSSLECLAYARGVAPLAVYQELCRLAGSLAVFTPSRRPGNLPQYQHDNLGHCFAEVIRAIRLGLDAAAYSSYEKRYFEAPAGAPEYDRLWASFEPAWRDSSRALYLGTEGVDFDISLRESEEIRRQIEMKLGSPLEAKESFGGRLRDFRLTAMSERPRALPPGFVYYRIEGERSVWEGVAGERALVLQVNPTRCAPDPGPPTATGEARPLRILKVNHRRVSYALFVT